MSARKAETTTTQEIDRNREITPEERERITVVTALRMAGARVYRGTMDAINAMAAITNSADPAMVCEAFLNAKGWTVVVHPPIAPKS